MTFQDAISGMGICHSIILKIELIDKSLPKRPTLYLLPFNPHLFDEIGGMELSTMDQNGACTGARAPFSTTVTTASFRMSRSGKNKACGCFQRNKD